MSALKGLIRKYTITNASMAAAFGLNLPIVTLMFLDKGLTLWDVGLLVSLFSISTMVFEVPFGTLADSLGRRKVFVLGEMCLIVATGGFWLADTLPLLMVAMMFSGMSRALLSGSLDALFVEQFNELAETAQEKSSYMAAQANMTSISTLCLGLAAILGGLLPMWFAGVTSTTDLIGFYEINYVILLPITAMHILVTVSLIEESKLVDKTKARGQFIKDIGPFIAESMRLVRGSSLLMGLIVVEFLAGIVFMVLTNLWQPQMAQLADSKSQLWLFGVLCSASFISMSVGYKLAIRCSELLKNNYVRLLAVLQVLIALAFTALAIFPHLVGFFVCYVLLSMLHGMTIAPTLALFHAQVQEQYRSTSLSVKSFFEQCGGLLGALAGGYIATTEGVSSVWMICAVLAALTVIVFIHPKFIVAGNRASAQSDQQAT